MISLFKNFTSFSNRCFSKDEIQAGRGFLSNRCWDPWQIPGDTQVTPETSAIMHSANATAPLHEWNQLFISPQERTIQHIQIPFPYPNKKVHPSGWTQQLLSRIHHPHWDHQYYAGWNIQATRRNCDHRTHWSTWSSKKQCRSNTRRMATTSLKLSLNSVKELISFKLFQQKVPPSTSAWALLSWRSLVLHY